MTTRHGLRAAVALTLALAAAAPAHAAGEYRTVETESLRITVDSEWVSSAAAGYLPVRWDITNLGEARTIEIVGDGSRFSRLGPRYTQSTTTAQQRIRLARGDHVRFTMSVPTGGETDSMRFQIREDGRTLQTLGVVSTHRLHGVSALIVVAPDSSYAALAPGWARPASGSVLVPTPAAMPVPPGGTRVATVGGTPAILHGGPPLDFILEPARLPTSWLGYTSVHAAVVGTREWAQMDESQRTAILTWTACGGSLILVDTGLDVLFPDPQERPALRSGVAEHFFGRIHLVSSAAVESGGFPATLAAVDKAAPEPSWVLPVRPFAPGAGATGFRLPIPGVTAVPAGAYLTILTIFAILIGPVNHLVLRHRRQQAFIVLTTPLIAAVFIVLLAGYVVVVEGFGVRGRAVTLTLLDQPRSQAVTRATVSLYAAGRAPSGGLRFARDVAVFPSVMDGTNRVREHLDLTEAQQFSAGLIVARAPANFETIGVRPARERLTVSREAERLRVSNGLGATIDRLRLRQGSRTFELNEPLPHGSTATLQETITSGRDLLRTGDAALARFDYIVTNQPDDSYLAVLDRSPFWDGGTRGVEERDSFHLVLGRTGPQP